MTELSETFILECEELDKDHKRLVEMVDDIAAKLDSGECENCKKLVVEFVNYAKGHFVREEQLLTKVGYPGVEKHRKHHSQLFQKMEHIVEFAGSVAENDLARESLKKELLFFIYDDVITTDMDFKEFVSNKR